MVVEVDDLKRRDRPITGDSNQLWSIVDVKFPVIDLTEMSIRFRTLPDNNEFEVEPKNDHIVSLLF
jgi:hypothetical protein